MWKVSTFVCTVLLLTPACFGGTSSFTGLGATSVSAPSGGGSASNPTGAAGNSNSTTAGGGTADGNTPAASAKTSLVWVWQDFANSIAAVVAHKDSFTHVSPALYDINYAYASGAPHLQSNSFDGLSASQVCQQVHAAGLKCVPLIYAGAGNDGTDQGIQNVLDNANGEQNNFINGMLSEAKQYGYDGFNLDWEVGNLGNNYSDKLASFLKATQTAFHAQNMEISLDIAGFYVQQCTGSGGNGFADVAKIGGSVDMLIMEDYAGSLGSSSSMACPATGPSSIDCDSNFMGGMEMLCAGDRSVANIGLISKGSNTFASDALNAVDAYGFKSVSVWPDDTPFMSSDGMPNGNDWYTVLAAWLKR